MRTNLGLSLRALLSMALLSAGLTACVDGGALSDGVKSPALKAKNPDPSPTPSESPSASPTPTPTPSHSSGSAVGSFEGCKDGQGQSTSSIEVNFDFVPTATQMSVYRDGALVFSTTSTSVTSFVDTGLTEGRIYRYTCEAIINNASIFGLKVLNLTPLSFQAPTFAGIRAVTALSPSSVLVEWNEATGVPANEYRVFAKLGAGVDWTASPTRTLGTGKKQVVLTNLGDELPYAFGVRACNASGVCDSNTVIMPLTMADGGAPTTSGATSASLSNDGVATINAPWQASNGAVKIRRVYQTSASPLTWANYTLAREVTVTDVTSPIQAITIPGIPDNTTMYFIVRDEDPSGHVNTNMNYVSVLSGDKTAPVFAGITSLSNVLTNASTAEGTLRASWTAIASEPADPNGASTYLVYLTSAIYPNTPANACSAGTLYTQTNSVAYTAGTQVTFDITGLNARTYYDVCVKARDAAGNISTTSNHLIKFTKDQTPPSFDGIKTLAFDYGAHAMQVGWDASTSTDVANYKIRMWKNTATPTAGDITTITRSAASFATGSPVSLGEFSISDNDVVYSVVDACDDAASTPIYNASNNCTNVSVATAISATVPDLTPPAGFTGITTAVAGNQGEVTVSWSAPASWADYAGFKIYKVDNTTFAYTPGTDLLKTCSCTANNCSANPITSCLVTGLNLRRTYTFYVTAIDAAGNETNRVGIDPDSVTSHASARTTDTTAPVFNPNLTGPVSMSGVSLSWNAATDTQYASEIGAAITYFLYRKDSTDFTTITPSAPGSSLSGIGDGTLIYTGTTTSYTDNSNIVQGATIYYTLCAWDASKNKTCYVRTPTFSVTVPDVTPPVISNLATNKLVSGTSWAISWTVTDNAPGNINVEVYRGPAGSCPSDGDAIAFRTSGTNLTSYSDSKSPASSSAYYCYLITATDVSGNKSTATINDLNPAPTVATVSPGQSTLPETGGDLLTITGTGFLNAPSGANVALKSGGTTLTCTSPSTNVATQTITCTTPTPPGAGTYDVVVTNFDGQSATKVGAFAYASFCSAYGNQTPWAGSTATPAQGGSGTPGNPYKICNATQLNNVRNSLGSSYKLMGDIDLQGVSFSSIGAAFAGYSGVFDGNGKTIRNWTTSSGTGLFAGVTGGTVKNLRMENVTITGSNTYVGAIIGVWDRMNGATMTNLSSSGTISGSTYVGGIIGRIMTNGVNAGATITGSYSSANVTGSQYVGGLVGSVEYTTIQDSYATGAVNFTSDSAGGLIGATVSSNGSTLIERCYATGNVTRPSNADTIYYAGGFIGQIGIPPVTIRRSYSTGNVGSSSSQGNESGGFVGQTSSSTLLIEDSYTTSAVMGKDKVGGFIGKLSSGSATIRRCYSNGSVTSVQDSTQKGGFSGWTISGISDSYWDTLNSGLGTDRSTGPLGKTTGQLATQGTFTGWDFSSGGNWAMPSGSGAPNYGAPILRCVTPGAPCP